MLPPQRCATFGAVEKPEGMSLMPIHRGFDFRGWVWRAGLAGPLRQRSSLWRTGSTRTAILLAIFAALPAHAETGRRYDSAGRFLGRSEGTTDQRVYDSAGRLVGSSRMRGDRIQHRDAAGRAQGRSERQGDTIRHYDAAGRSMGRRQWTGDTARLYDPSGRSEGRIERSGRSWRRYDAQGRLIGRGSGPVPVR